MNIISGVFGELVTSEALGRFEGDALNKYGAIPIRHVHSGGVLQILGEPGHVGTAQTQEVALYVIGRVIGDNHASLANHHNQDEVARTLLAEYLDSGTDFVSAIDGQFLIVIVDDSDHRTGVQMITDPGGMRTAYCYSTEDGFAFSTNLKSLKSYVSELAFDDEHQDFLLTYGFLPGDRTVYRNVSAIPARTVLTRDTAGHVARASYLPIDYGTRKVPAGEDAVLDALHDAFMSAIDDLLPPDSALGVLLGGFDSALVAAGLVATGRTVHTYTFSYDDSSYDQPLTDKVTEALGSTHHRVPVTMDAFRDRLRGYADVFNRPTVWPNYVIQTALAAEQMQADGITTCFSGDGCDTLFLGYPGTFRRTQLINRLPRLPGPLVQSLVRMASIAQLDRRIGHPYRVFLGLLGSMGNEEPDRSFLTFRVMDEVSIRQLRRDARPVHTAGIKETAQNLARQVDASDPYRLAYLGKSLVSPNKTKIVGAADLTGVPILSPYLHPGLAGFARSLPLEDLRPSNASANATGKHALQLMAIRHALLPPEVVLQPKVAAVDAPVDEWYAGPMREELHEMIRRLPFDPDPDYVDTLLSTSWFERQFRDRVMVDRVITHAASILATYSTYAL